VWQSPVTAGRPKPVCPVTPHTNMVQCRWAASLSFTVGRAWVQGEYLIKLVGSGGQQSYVPLTITDPTNTAAYVIMDGSLTDNASGGYLA
ncbi:MAG TPA: N,N-dimethylformamidase beta subunit family domain-containing protein, partial [Mycobacteriales bacterium]